MHEFVSKLSAGIFCPVEALKLFLAKVIPQYCTAHPVLLITKHNQQQNIMAAFLPGKLAREK